MSGVYPVAHHGAQFEEGPNWNDLSTPWVGTLLRHVEDEFKASGLHAVVFKQICGTPFQNVGRKREVVAKLYALREESSRRLSGLCALAPIAAELCDKRAALDGVSDSYFDNEALSLGQAAATNLDTRYSEMLRDYLHALRRFAHSVCLRKAGF